jgi:hypothetical protein
MNYDRVGQRSPFGLVYLAESLRIESVGS